MERTIATLRDASHYVTTLPLHVHDDTRFFFHAGLRPGVPLVAQSNDESKVCSIGKKTLTLTFVPRFELMLEVRSRKRTTNKRVGGNRHDNEVGKCRLCSLARILWLGRNRSYRIGGGPVSPRAPARWSAIAGASPAVGSASTAAGHRTGQLVRGYP